MANFIEALQTIVGSNGLIQGADVAQRPNQSWGQGSCPAKAIVRPSSTDELSQVMKLCHENNQVVVPWGGLSGLVNGISCQDGDVVLSMERMNTVEVLDDVSGTVTVQAGVIIQQLQEAVAEKGWLFPVDFGARGSAQVGGAIATNAGGNSVIRYGMMREQVLGLEVVLADGTVISSMNEMLKNNSGYDLKQFFIGSEGTLGIVTRAVLRLRPAHRGVQTAFVAVNSFDDIPVVLKRLGMELDGKLSAFEVMWQKFYQFMVSDKANHAEVIPAQYPYYILIESSGGDEDYDQEHFLTVFGNLLEEGLLADAVIAQTESQVKALWEMRDDVATVGLSLYPMVVFDISLPLVKMKDYMSAIEAQLNALYPDADMITFGHLGDGNIHLVVGPTEDKAGVEKVVYEQLVAVGGSISAEHGIGLDKKPYLQCSRSESEIALMKAIKSTIDPNNILNPNKIF